MRKNPGMDRDGRGELPSCVCARAHAYAHLRKLTPWQHQRALTSGFELRIFLPHAWLAFFLCEVKILY